MQSFSEGGHISTERQFLCGTICDFLQEFKALKHVLLKPLTRLANLSVNTSTFYKIWISGHIIHVHKKGPKLNPDNYRPVILMSNLGNLLESVVIGDVIPKFEVNLPD